MLALPCALPTPQAPFLDGPDGTPSLGGPRFCTDKGCSRDHHRLVRCQLRNPLGIFRGLEDTHIL